uniref:Uncharacterized protein n=1 Tax=viral metagenome TaxID=1070528 RepID=A0A6H1ZPE5_9ZZZZ
MKEYLGDSVYAMTDDVDGIILTTENGKSTDPSNIIYLEPNVIEALLNFLERVS